MSNITATGTGTCSNGTTYTYNSNGFITVPVNTSNTQIYSFFPLESITLDLDYQYTAKQSKVKVGNEEGYECTDCKDFYPMAELNQPDNAKDFISFTCYGCRKGLKTLFEIEDVNER